MDYPLVVWPDTPTSDRQIIELIGLKTCPVRAEQFGLIDDEAGEYFIKFFERPVNFSPTLPREDAATFSALTKKLEGDLKKTSIEQHNMLHYIARLIGYREKGMQEITEVLTAPALGASVRLATDHEAIEFLSLPPHDLVNRFGAIFNTTIPLCLSLEVLCHHILMAGATGQGKTTAITNLIAGAYAMGATVFLFDNKPDYQHIEDCSVSRQALGLTGIPRSDISYWNLNARRAYRDDALPINVHFSELDAQIYAALASSTDTMRDSFFELLLKVETELRGEGKTQWDLMADVWPRLPKKSGDSNFHRLFKDGEGPHTNTLNSLGRLSRAKPRWVDVMSSGQGAFRRPHAGLSFFEMPQFLQPGHIHVTQVTPAQERDYGLFLTTLMHKVKDARDNEMSDHHPIFIVMDEAEDVFAGTLFAKACIPQIAEVIRKGRSQKVGVVISVQSASNIPEDIAQNLNTIIAFRHNSEEAAGHIKRLLDRDARNLQNLDKGDAIVRTHGAKSAVRAKLDREAFRLVGTVKEGE